jgi:hypothetical protein
MFFGKPEFNIEPKLSKTSQQVVRERKKELAIKSYSPHQSRMRCFINCAECCKRRCICSRLEIKSEEKKS